MKFREILALVAFMSWVTVVISFIVLVYAWTCNELWLLALSGKFWFLSGVIAWVSSIFALPESTTDGISRFL